jgi:hypothetical protein
MTSLIPCGIEKCIVTGGVERVFGGSAEYNVNHRILELKNAKSDKELLSIYDDLDDMIKLNNDDFIKKLIHIYGIKKPLTESLKELVYLQLKLLDENKISTRIYVDPEVLDTLEISNDNLISKMGGMGLLILVVTLFETLKCQRIKNSKWTNYKFPPIPPYNGSSGSSMEMSSNKDKVKYLVSRERDLVNIMIEIERYYNTMTKNIYDLIDDMTK